MISGTQVRLVSMELFYDTGIGKEGYSIIGQGQIDKILSGKPEKENFSTEAAGIVKIKRRKNEALENLTTRRQNLVEFQTILGELKDRWFL